MKTTDNTTTPAQAPGTVPALVRCSQSGCTAPATWRRQSWGIRLPDQPVCDEHVKFYQACGLRCAPITPNVDLTGSLKPEKGRD